MKLPNTFSLQVKVFAGSDIQDVSFELCALATRLGVLVEADFNGVLLWARPNNNPIELVDAYHHESKSDSKYKIAQVKNYT